MKEITVAALTENLQLVLDFVNSELEATNCQMKTQMQIAIAVEEIYINIAQYAYYPDSGLASIRCEVGGHPLQVTIRFMDSGKPYNPLTQNEPDITLSAEAREIGGLGIYLAKKSMDHLEYQYKDEKNILTIRKNIDS